MLAATIGYTPNSFNWRRSAALLIGVRTCKAKRKNQLAWVQRHKFAADLAEDLPGITPQNMPGSMKTRGRLRPRLTKPCALSRKQQGFKL